MYNLRYEETSIYTLLVCLSVCLLFVSNKRQNGWFDRAQIVSSLYLIKISKISLYQNPRTFLLFIYNVYNEKIFTFEIEEIGAKRLESLVTSKNMFYSYFWLKLVIEILERVGKRVILSFNSFSCFIFNVKQ